jgi:hypothetical protein
MAFSPANLQNEMILTFVVPMGSSICFGGIVAVNDDVAMYIQTKKDLQQDDPLSPILFNLVVDMLAILISRAQHDGQIQGLIPYLIDDGL